MVVAMRRPNLSWCEMQGQLMASPSGPEGALSRCDACESTRQGSDFCQPFFPFLFFYVVRHSCFASSDQGHLGGVSGYSSCSSCSVLVAILFIYLLFNYLQLILYVALSRVIDEGFDTRTRGGALNVLEGAILFLGAECSRRTPWLRFAV